MSAFCEREGPVKKDRCNTESLIILPVLHRTGSRPLHPIGGRSQWEAARSPTWVCGPGALIDDGSADERKTL